MSEVQIRPLPHKTWHNKEGKESFRQPVTIEVLYDSNKGGYATGLTDEEAERYGKLLGVDLSANFNPEKPHPYWSTKGASIKLPNNTLILNDEIPRDFVKIKNLKASKFVANTFEAWEAGLYPNATHYIYDEETEVIEKATKVQARDKAIAIKHKMSNEDKISIIMILSRKMVRGRSSSFLDVEIDELLKDHKNVLEFLRYTSMDREEVYTNSLVLECIHKNILTKEGGSIYYMGELIAYDIDEAIKWFLDPNNSKLKGSILGKLTGQVK
jgi:hypothetical protein